MPRRIFLITSLLVAAFAPSASARTFHFGTIGSADSAKPATTILRKAEAVRNGRDKAGPFELTPLLKELAVRASSLHGSDRVAADRLLARPTIGEASLGEDAYTVPEHRPAFCSQHFCIHWVDSTVDAPPLTDANGNGVPDYVETMDGVFEHVYDVENNQLGWRPPKPDDGLGGNDLTDVYIKDLGNQGIYGYSAPDPRQNTYSQHAYLVMENDYSIAQYPKYGGDPLPPMEVTAAHEYNHVLQFGYDFAQDTWMFEATAVWMEDRVYNDVNDYLQYMTPWAQLSFVPITQFDAVDQGDPYNIKVYGDSVLNRWIDSHYGPDTVRAAWEQSLNTTPKSFAPGAYDAALRAHGTTFYDTFAQLAAATAEWRDSNSEVAEGNTFPDMQRVADRASGREITLTPDTGSVSGRISHTAFGLVDVRPTNAARIRLVFHTARGPQMAAAIVCRIGDEVTGTSQTILAKLPHGGLATLVLDDPGRCSRITAVLINADGRTTGRFSRSLQDWEWRSDEVPVDARVSTDFTPPSVRSRNPKPGAHGVAITAHLRIAFSEPLEGLDSAHVWLIGPGGHKVRARIKHSGARVEIIPERPLRRGTRYTVRLSGAIDDFGGNSLPASARRWTFSTAR